TGRPPKQMPGLDIGHELAESCCVSSATELETELTDAGTPVRRRKGDEAGISEGLYEFSCLDIPPPISLTRECQHCVRPRPDLAGHLLRKMDAQERKCRIRYGIDQTFHKTFRASAQDVVAPPERNDFRTARPIRHCGESISLQSPASHHEACADSGSRGDSDACFVLAKVDRTDRTVRSKGTA